MMVAKLNLNEFIDKHHDKFIDKPHDDFKTNLNFVDMPDDSFKAKTQ